MGRNSFFTSIRSYFMFEGDCDPNGRYFAICLKEALEENSRLIQDVTGKMPAGARMGSISTEHTFSPSPISAKTRRADIAVETPVGYPQVLFEIKCADSFMPGQLKDYARYAKKCNVPLVFITRVPMEAGERAVVQRYGVPIRNLTFSDLHKILIGYPRSQYPICALLAGYLQENEMIYTRYLPGGFKILLEKIFFAGSRAAVVTKGAFIDDIPEAFRIMSANAMILSQAVLDRTPYRRKDIRPTLNMWVNPYLPVNEVERLLKRAKKNNDPDIYVKSSKMIGELYVESTLTLGNSKKWFALKLGFFTEIKKLRKTPRIKIHFYSWFEPDKQEASWVESKPFEYSKDQGYWDLTSEEEMLDLAVKSVKASRGKFVNYYSKRKANFPKEFKNTRLAREFEIV